MNIEYIANNTAAFLKKTILFSNILALKLIASTWEIK
jgi:hypothetical protein